MPDRRLREQILAGPDRLAAIETKQRVMSTRVWPGAMRTGSADVFTPDVDPSKFNSMILVDALPGRWMVMGQFDLSCPSSVSGPNFEFKLAAFDSETGVEEPEFVTSDLSDLIESLDDTELAGLPRGASAIIGHYDFPTYYYSSTSTGAVRFPVTLIGHFLNETDSNKSIAMQCRETAKLAWSVTNIRLKLIPR